jgi:hypothetical protein
MFTIGSAFSTTSSISKKSIDVQKYIGTDTLTYIPTEQFNMTRTTNSLSRYDLFNGNIQYITQDSVHNLTIQEQAGDAVDMRVFTKTENTTTELVYEDVYMFGGSGLVLTHNKTEGGLLTNIQISLPAVNQHIYIPPTKEIVYGTENQIISEKIFATTTEDILTRINTIKQNIQNTNITSYIKSRYVMRLNTIQKNIIAKKGGEKDIALLRQKAEQSVASIRAFASSPALRGRYAKIKQDYMYLSYILR